MARANRAQHNEQGEQGTAVRINFLAERQQVTRPRNVLASRQATAATFALRNACCRSAIRSSTCSIPTLIRIKLA